MPPLAHPIGNAKSHTYSSRSYHDLSCVLLLYNNISTLRGWRRNETSPLPCALRVKCTCGRGLRAALVRSLYVPALTINSTSRLSLVCGSLVTHIHTHRSSDVTAPRLFGIGLPASGSSEFDPGTGSIAIVFVSVGAATVSVRASVASIGGGMTGMS